MLLSITIHKRFDGNYVHALGANQYVALRARMEKEWRHHQDNCSNHEQREKTKTQRMKTHLNDNVDMFMTVFEVFTEYQLWELSQLYTKIFCRYWQLAVAYYKSCSGHSTIGSIRVAFIRRKNAQKLHLRNGNLLFIKSVRPIPTRRTALTDSWAWLAKAFEWWSSETQLRTSLM